MIDDKHRDNSVTNFHENFDEEREEDVTTLQEKVSIRKLWRFANAKDLSIIFAGSLIAIMTGAGMPLMSIIVGNISSSFIKMTRLQTDPDSSVCDGCNETFKETYSQEKFHDEVINQCIAYAILGSVVYVAAFVQVSCFLISGEQLIYKMRLAFFRGILHQDITWFDKNNSGTLTTKLFDNLERVKEGTGDKVGLLIQFMSQFFTGFIIAFTYDWKMTLIMMSLAPFMVISGLFTAKFMESAAQSEAKEYAKAGAIAEQALGSIRTVVAFNGQPFECEQYTEALNRCKSEGTKKNIYVGIALGSTFVIIFASYCLAFWIGTGFVANGTLSAKTVLTVFFSILMGSVALGQAGQQFAVIGTAQGAAAAIFEIIDRTPKIDSYEEKGQKPQNIKGEISIENVKFSYPTRKDIEVCKGISFKAEPGKTVALVGSSGCGKSTIVQLLLRYYNPDSGRILIDGLDISTINIEYLRKLIAVVSQEPILFNCSIEENILYGNENITQKQMVEACRMANADSFISKLPQGYKTIVGERGTQLSGGQKQRIAIARALIRNPKILLLDEATSALDAESESIVQLALDKARQGRTTIVIAHRLSTIKNSDKIISMKNGQIVEVGTHDELMERKGLYFELVNAQAFVDVEEKHEERIKRKYSHISERSRTSSVLSIRRTNAAFSIDSFIEPNVEDDEKSVTKRLMKELQIECGKEEDLMTIIKHARPWWWILIIATISSIINGVVFPAFSLFFSEIMTIFSTPDVHKMKRDGRFWSIMLLLCGVVQGITAFFQSALMGYVAEQLTTKLRSDLFRNVMRQDIAYFDKENHSSGKISTRLATDTPNVKSAIDYRFGTVIAALVSIICGLIISFYYSWPMALLVLGIFPLGIAGRTLQLKYLKGSTEKDARDMESAGNIALQGIENIRTVQALTLEKKFYFMFKECLSGPHKSAKKDAIIQGMTYGFSTSILYFIFAASFRFALWLILYHSTKPMHVMKVLMAISFSMGNIGFAAAYFPEYKKARLAAGIIFKMLNEIPKIDSLSKNGTTKDFVGNVHFNDLWFSYPERPTVQILKGLDICVKPGETLALVGPSGCGKSTVVSLLERFYDPNHGKIAIDEIDLCERNISHVRSKMAIVSQEPVLFDCSIKDNLIYGFDRRNFTNDEIKKAAELANIDKFIENLPAGYETRVGEKGTQLSGGQKQRIAIARALIRNPKILLLDEATSALDAESEKIVQEALNRASEGRTCIVIAHRLSTIVNADCIAVCNNGVIVEKGTHQELMALKGTYFNLTQKQLHAKTA